MTTLFFRHVAEDMLLKDTKETRALQVELLEEDKERTQNKSRKNKSADINDDSSVTGREGRFIT